jgi:hypothetical protein
LKLQHKGTTYALNENTRFEMNVDGDNFQPRIEGFRVDGPLMMQNYNINGRRGF